MSRTIRRDEEERAPPPAAEDPDDGDAAAPTFSPDGLYFLGPVYDEGLNLPTRTAAFDWLPR